MLVSTKWLAEYVNTQGLDPKELGEKITRSGIEVDAVIDRSQGMTNVVVGYVLGMCKASRSRQIKYLPSRCWRRNNTNYLWCSKC